MLSALLIAVAFAGAGESNAAAIAKADRLYQAFEYERAIAILSRVVQRPDGRQNSEAHRLLGQCYAVLGRVSEARESFERLVELDPSFDMPESTPPKIRMVFRQAKADVEERVQREAEQQRRERLGSIELEARFPNTTEGGLPVTFELQLRDPTGMVGSVSVMYRSSDTKDFSSLALENDGTDRWLGVLPGELTANEAGLELTFYAQAFDSGSRPLIAEPAPPAVNRIRVTPGDVQVPYYETVWFWSTVGGLVLAIAGTTAAILLTGDEPAGDLEPYTFPP